MRAADIEALAGWDPAAQPSERDRVHARARADAGLHRRARRRRPRGDARRDGADGRRPREDQPARARRARDRPLRAGRRLRHARRLPRSTPSASSSATRSATRSCAGARRRSSTSRSCRRTPGSCTRSTSSTSRASSSSARRRRSAARSRRRAYPDTLVGTDSHTTMVNGLGVLGWGVGGIEAEAAMLGQPMSMLIPQVRRLPLHGALPRGRDRDRPRADRHRDAARARRRRQVRRVLRRRPRRPAARRPRDDRQHVARVRLDLRDLPDRRGDAALPASSPGARASRSSWSRPTRASRGSGTTSDSPEPTLLRQLELDLGAVVPSLAGPKRPQDRVSLTDAQRGLPRRARRLRARLRRRRRSGRGDVPRERSPPRRRPPTARPAPRATAARAAPEARPRRARRRAQRRQRRDAARARWRRHSTELDHGHVVIAAITSCTNTSNPSVMIGAGILARNALARGPAAQAVGEDLAGARARRSSPNTSTAPGSPSRWSSSASTSSATAARPASATPARCRRRSRRPSARRTSRSSRCSPATATSRGASTPT